MHCFYNIVFCFRLKIARYIIYTIFTISVFLKFYKPQYDFCLNIIIVDRGSTVVKVLCYKLEGRWFDPSWCHCNFSLI